MSVLSATNSLLAVGVAPYKNDTDREMPFCQVRLQNPRFSVPNVHARLSYAFMQYANKYCLYRNQTSTVFPVTMFRELTENISGCRELKPAQRFVC